MYVIKKARLCVWVLCVCVLLRVSGAERQEAGKRQARGLINHGVFLSIIQSPTKRLLGLEEGFHSAVQHSHRWEGPG